MNASKALKSQGASDVTPIATSKRKHLARLSIVKLTDELAKFQRNGGDDYRKGQAA